VGGAKLVRHDPRRLTRETAREVHEISSKVLERLRNDSWPSNVRELRRALEQALLRAGGTVLPPAFQPEAWKAPARPKTLPGDPS